MFCIYMMYLQELLSPDCAMQYPEPSHWMVGVADVVNFFAYIWEATVAKLWNVIFFYRKARH